MDNMNVMETIREARFEKNLRESWKSTYREIFGNLNESVSDADILNIKYNKTAESLREYKYEEKILKLLKEGMISSLTAESFRNDLLLARKLVEANDVFLISEGYEKLSRNMYILENGTEFIK